MAGNRLIAILTLNDKMTRELGRVARGVRSFGAGLRREFRAVGRQVLNLRNALVVVAAGAAARMAAQFETSMSQIVGLVGVAEEQVASFSEQVLNMAAEVGRGPRELADALFFITSAGLRGAEAMKALKASAKAAAAGLGETKQVADAVTSAMNAYGTATLSAEQATAVLVATVREGKAAAEEIGPALGSVLPIAAELGVSFDQVGASIAAMTRLGLNAAESSTALRAVLGTLLKPTESAKDEMQRLGISAEGLRRQVREEGLLAALFTLKEAVGDNQDAMAKIVPNVRALTGVLSLVRGEGKETQAIFDSLARTTEEDLARAFNVATKTAAFAMAQFRAEIERVAIAFGGFINTVGTAGVFVFLKETMTGLAEAMRDTGDNTDAARSAADAMIGTLRVVGTVAAAAVDAMSLLRLAWLKFSEVAVRADLGVENLIPVVGQLLILKRVLSNEVTPELQALQREQDKIIEKFVTGKTALATITAAMERADTAVRNLRTSQDTLNRSLSEGAESSAAWLRGMQQFNDQLTALKVNTREVSQSVAGSSSELDRLTERVGAQTGKMKEWVEAGRDGGLMLERLIQAERFLKGEVEAGAAAFVPFRDEVRAFTAQMNIAIPTSEELATTIAALPEGAQGFILAADSIGEMNARLREAQDEMEATQARAALVAQMIQTFANSVADFVGQVLQEAFEGQIRTIQDVGRIAQQVLQNLLRSVIQELIRLAVTAALTRAVAGAATGAIVEGGVAGQVGGVPMMAGGGVIRGPGMFVAGERGREAIVPLPDGRAIPAIVTEADGGDGGQATNVNINITAFDSEDVERVLSRPEAQQVMRARIVDAMRNDPQLQTEVNGSV